MDVKLTTQAELLAQKAEELPAFSGLKLLHIKRQLKELLDLIGRNGVFDEYTKHDISHVDEMLRILDWLIPDDTKAVMSHADWLMTVLSIYFHDVGMLVTKEEFNMRESSGFPDYRDKVLFAGEHGTDYKSKISELGREAAERFLYQEFVRHKHAERIFNWIMGRASEHLGIAPSIIAEIDEILTPLGLQFRRDLGLVCESHHSDDISDYRKYKTSQPYGNSEAETANLQYAAILLRTTDLLHITRDRTPSIVFQLINPTNPISQIEWAKQMAVTRVRSKVGRSREGNPDEYAPRDTIEVHAFFRVPNGFFGLTSYLVYAQEQLRKSYEWASLANRQMGTRHSFPWRFIDDSNIETDGFLRDTFEFSIDQAKILDLLTGHTLYNDTNVVLRELVQNSLDAIRLQKLIDQREGHQVSRGRVEIIWDSKQRILTVNDNGTGMTQNIIERHLLRVGSSRYQDSEFVRQYPNFTGISRFGIGLLSTFMIADEVEIITCHPDDDQARQLSLRSVHGKYLIRLVDKQTDSVIKSLLPHGTIVRLKVRPSANLDEIIDIARRWIVVPKCDVFVTLDDNTPVKIGFDSLKDALIDLLTNLKIPVDQDLPSYPYHVRVIERQLEDTTVAYAIYWSKYFQEWAFYELDEQHKRDTKGALLGICIEGVRITFDSPGFSTNHVVAIANAQGPHAPKTNVARSGLEVTREREAMLHKLYTLYCDHIKSEIDELILKYHYSLTWAIQEAKYMLSSFLTEKSTARRTRDALDSIDSKESLIESIKKLPIILVEKSGGRKNISSAELHGEDSFWTIDSAFFRFAEMLIRESSGPASLSNLDKILANEKLRLPNGTVLCYSGYEHELIERIIFSNREVSEIYLIPEQRRIDLKWSNRSEKQRWQALPDWFDSSLAMDFTGSRLLRSTYGSFNNVKIGLDHSGVLISGNTDEFAIRTLGVIYILPDTEISKYLQRLLNEAEKNRNTHKNIQGKLDLVYSVVIGVLLNLVANQSSRRGDLMDSQMNTLRVFGKDLTMNVEDFIDLNELGLIIDRTQGSIYDTSVWERRDFA